MTSSLVGIRIESKLLAEARKAATKDGYKNVQEFLRETLRQAIIKRRFDQLAGSNPSIGRLTREERDTIARKLEKEVVKKNLKARFVRKLVKE